MVFPSFKQNPLFLLVIVVRIGICNQTLNNNAVIQFYM